MNSFAIEINGLEKRFKEFSLGPIDLNIPTGCIVGYIGQNGAGKSTTIKLMLGLLKKNSGSIKLLGEEVNESHDIKNRVGVVFDDLFLPEELKLNDVEKFCSRVFSKWDRNEFLKYQNLFKITENKLIKNLSRGMKMKLSMAIALSHGAELLILDEATSGLDPIVREEILDILLEFMQEENHTILMSSHILSDLEKIADYIAFIHNGKVLLVESKDELKDNYAICSVSDKELAEIDPNAIIGKRIHSFGQEILVRRDLVPNYLDLQKPSIEEIMIYIVRGEMK